jgi:septum formation protein
MLILASASPARAALLRKAGIPFEIAASRARELKGRGRTLRDAVLENARRKAAPAARRFPGRWVLAADTMIDYRGRLYGKPRDRKSALDLLCRLAGDSHRLATGVVFRRDLRRIERVVVSRVMIRDLDRKPLAGIVARTDPTRLAGGYAVRRGRDRLIERIDGSFTNVVGLPMEFVGKIVRTLR